MKKARYASLTALAGPSITFLACQPKSEETSDVKVPEETPVVTSETAPEAAPAVVPAVAPAAPTYDSVEEKVSYGIGYNMGRQMGMDPSIEIDATAIKAGIDDGLAGNESQLTEDVMRAAFTELQQRAEAAAAVGSEAAIAAGEAFLAANAERPEVTMTESGLQYEVLVEGDGESPTPGDTVEVHYHGTLVDGTVFDSSVDRGETIEFPVTGVIAGWVEALQLMQVGDKWKLYIPHDLAYGPRGSGQIPPYAPLVFEVELIAIK